MHQILTYKGAFMHQILMVQKKEINIILKKYASPRIIPTPLNSKPFLEAWNKWLIFLFNKKFRFSDGAIKYQLSFLHSHSTDAVTIINKSISKEWLKLYPLKSEFKESEKTIFSDDDGSYEYTVSHNTIIKFSYFLDEERNINKYLKFENKSIFNKLSRIEKNNLMVEMVELMDKGHKHIKQLIK